MLSRLGDNNFYFFHAIDANINNALKKALYESVKYANPSKDKKKNDKFKLTENEGKLIAKKAMWVTHWIYRCPKISLKDILQLENRPDTIKYLNEYLGKNTDEIIIPSNVYRICG